MSFFRPHKSKPRQFNYIPRYYDPVKEERDHRRRVLHGTSSSDSDEDYVPGKYIRTQREARDAARESEAGRGNSRIRNLVIMAAILTVIMLVFVPRFVSFFNMAREEQQAQKAQQEQAVEKQRRKMEIVEHMESVEGIDDPKRFMENLDEMEAWQRSVGSITIVPNDTELEE